MTKPALNQKSRTYSKKIVAWSLAGIYLLALLGRDAEVIYAVGAVAMAHLGLYIGTGHLDLRTWLASGLMDIRKKGP
ncbi:hypothetical protein HFO32_22070 [Rhizobium leguminosarum]|uniref:hypothetical protein n=1 Tax=Rhizobium leguminosarum TaxID=384 RepID=UPI001C97081B|nr:hypothetical protein [Rhizobium leguminosarum]MBY5684812.1 hypothetical protein [Rhizobium leguminosarum]